MIVKQEEGEVFEAFLNDLMELSKGCEFCLECRDGLIRDRIVVGIRDVETLDKLLMQAGSFVRSFVPFCLRTKAKDLSI